MGIHTLFGVDPGIVHTGVVMFKFDTITKNFRKEFAVIDGTDPGAVASWIRARNTTDHGIITIEKYDDRGTAFSQHAAMREMETNLKRLIPGALVLSNTGIKKVITQATMKLFELWDYSEKTHHQDLRSAARIGLYGGIKDEATNTALAKVMMHHLGKTIE